MAFETLSDRLNHALELTGTRKIDLARAIDVKPQAIQFLCNSKTQSSRFTFEIATALGLNTRWLATGEGEMFLADDPKYKLTHGYKHIPILDPETVLLNEQSLSEQKSDQWTAIKDNGSKTVFCIEVFDASMEPRIPKGASIFFEKYDGTPPRSGDTVLAYISDYKTFAIRTIHIDQGKTFLKPENTVLFNEMELHDDVKLLGTAIECRFSLRGYKA